MRQLLAWLGPTLFLATAVGLYFMNQAFTEAVVVACNGLGNPVVLDAELDEVVRTTAAHSFVWDRGDLWPTVAASGAGGVLAWLLATWLMARAVYRFPVWMRSLLANSWGAVLAMVAWLVFFQVEFVGAPEIDQVAWTVWGPATCTQGGAPALWTGPEPTGWFMAGSVGAVPLFNVLAALFRRVTS